MRTQSRTRALLSTTIKSLIWALSWGTSSEDDSVPNASENAISSQ
jgi:hypothetical protein